MSGTPTEAELQTLLQRATAVFENARAYIDNTLTGAGGDIDDVVQALEGSRVYVELPNALAGFRATAQALINRNTARALVAPIILEYARLLPVGSGKTTIPELMQAIREHWRSPAQTIRRRDLTFAAAVAGGANVGNLTIERLNVDEDGQTFEDATAETKTFRCIADMNSGARQWAERFSVAGTEASYDAAEVGRKGTGDSGAILRASHGGSESNLLRNGSFAEYSAASTPKFTGWTEVSGGSLITEDTTNVYRQLPGESTARALRMTAGGGTTIEIRQPISEFRQQTFERFDPVYVRVMVNKTPGVGVGGTLTLTFGAQTLTVNVVDVPAGWTELRIPIGTGCYRKAFNSGSLFFGIKWTPSTSSGYIVFDEATLVPWTRVDSTYWLAIMRAASPVASLAEDIYTAATTGGAPGTGKIGWLLKIAGFGHLPSSATPTLADPA